MWRALSGVALTLLPLLSACHSTTRTVSADPCGDHGWRVHVVPSSVRTTAVLFDGTRNGSCCRDFVCVGSPDVSLGQVVWGEDGCTGRELVVFAPGLAPQRRAYPDALPEQVELPSAARVVVKLWVVAKGTEVQTIVARGTEDVAVAAERLDALASGVRLKLGATTGISSDASPAQAIGNRCEVVSRSLDRDQPSAQREYHAAGDTLNVYYVATVAPDCPAANPLCYGDEGSGAIGWLHGISCASNDPEFRGRPDILFVSGELSSRAETLLHELGHSLGLIRPAWGHTNDLEDFPERTANLMYDGANTVENITVGQLWRLHYEPTSWLFPPGVASAFKACQENPRDNVPCPPLALRTRQRWP